ncbi:uncharacterized protein LOC143468737 [Clavelina lepadiformis]|uniref:uncharacterized protein LOC143468737 n=1 Tax=Clavelina lepadiformis TaxID=159417 RepID=UPI0040413D39
MNGLSRLDTEEQNMSEEEFLYELQKKTLDNLRGFLCNNLRVDRLFPYLQSKNILSSDDCEFIRSCRTTTLRVDTFINVVKGSGPDGFRQLVKAIKKYNKTQLFVAEKMELEYRILQKLPENSEKLKEIRQGLPLSPPPYENPTKPFPTPQPGPPPYQPRNPLHGSNVQSTNFHLVNHSMLGIRMPPTPVMSEWPSLPSSQATDPSFMTWNGNPNTFQTGDFQTVSGSVKSQCLPDTSETNGKMTTLAYHGDWRVSSEPMSHISDQITKISNYAPPANCSFLPSSVVDDQSIEFEKHQGQMKRLRGRPSQKNSQRSRTPTENESLVSDVDVKFTSSSLSSLLLETICTQTRTPPSVTQSTLLSPSGGDFSCDDCQNSLDGFQSFEVSGLPEGHKE